MAFANGERFEVPFGRVFPNGCALVPDSVSEVQDYNEHTKARTPSKDKVTGGRVFQVRVMDLDPTLDGKAREVAVKILADHQPVPPTGAMFEPVEFEGLMFTPYVNASGRLTYSFRATAMVAPRSGVKSGAPAAGSGPASASASAAGGGSGSSSSGASKAA